MITKLKSEFSRNVLILMTGATISQAIPIVISQISTRIYTPEDFGIFVFYTLGMTDFGLYNLVASFVMIIIFLTFEICKLDDNIFEKFEVSNASK